MTVPPHSIDITYGTEHPIIIKNDKKDKLTPKVSYNFVVSTSRGGAADRRDPPPGPPCIPAKCSNGSPPKNMALYIGYKLIIRMHLAVRRFSKRIERKVGSKK